MATHVTVTNAGHAELICAKSVFEPRAAWRTHFQRWQASSKLLAEDFAFIFHIGDLVQA